MDGVPRKRHREPLPWPSAISSQNVHLRYAWKRPCHTELELPVRSLHFTRRREAEEEEDNERSGRVEEMEAKETGESTQLTENSRVELFSLSERFLCWQLPQAIPKLFEKFGIHVRWLYLYEKNGKVIRPSEQLVRECVEMVMFFTEWTHKIAPVLPPEDFEAVVRLFFEKALWLCKELFSHLGPETPAFSGEIETRTSRTFVAMMFRSCVMDIHMKLLAMNKLPVNVFDKNARDGFVRENMLAVLQLTADRRWFLSPAFWPEDGDASARPVQPALSWLQTLLTWIQRQNDRNVWQHLLAAFCDAPNAIKGRANYAEEVWDFVAVVLAPLHSRIGDTMKKCDFCRQNATICGGWSLVNQLTNKDKTLDGANKITRIETMLKLWCPDRESTTTIKSLFGEHLNTEVSLSAFLGNGVFQLTDRPLSLALAEGTFSRALILLRNYAIRLEQVAPEKLLSFLSRVRSPFFVGLDKISKHATSEAELKLLIQYYSSFLSLGTPYGLNRVYSGMSGITLADSELAGCESNLRAVLTKAFHLFAALCQDFSRKTEFEDVITKFRAWVKFDGLVVYVLDIMESLLARSSFSYASFFPLLGDMLKDEQVFERPGERRQRALEILLRLLTPDMCTQENLPTFCEWETRAKNVFQASLKGGDKEAMLLARASARLTHICHSKNGVEIKDFELKPIFTMSLSAVQRKNLYFYWCYVFSLQRTEGTNEEEKRVLFTEKEEEEQNSFRHLLTLASSSSFSFSFSLLRFLFEIFRGEVCVSRFEYLSTFLSSFASLLDSVKFSGNMGKGVVTQENKIEIISDVFLYLFREMAKMNTEEISRLVVALGVSNDSMKRLREIVLTKIICPLLIETQCYKHLVVSLLDMTASLCSQGVSAQEFALLPATLAHFLTFSQAKPWERVGWISLRALVYDVVTRISSSNSNRKEIWSKNFCLLLQASVLRDLDEVKGGSHPKPTYSAMVERLPTTHKFYLTEMKNAEAPAQSVSAEQCLHKGIATLCAVLETVPSSFIAELDKVLGGDMDPNLIQLRQMSTCVTVG